MHFFAANRRGSPLGRLLIYLIEEQCIHAPVKNEQSLVVGMLLGILAVWRCKPLPVDEAMNSVANHSSGFVGYRQPDVISVVHVNAILM